MSDFTFAPPARAVHTLFIHCSASDRPEHDDVAVMRDWHVNGNGWADVGYHYYVKRDGTIQPGRPLEKTPAAQGDGYNAGTIAICFGGLTKSKFTSEQFRAGAAMVRAMYDAYGERGVRLRVRGHREVTPKECPVFDYRRAFGLDAAGYPTGTPDATVQGSEPAGAANVPGDLYIMVRNKVEAVKALQRALNAAGAALDPDGDFGRLTFEALRAWQAAHGLPASGIADAATRRALGLAA
ncbi:peptidoglycan-binding domain-containing protein [Reyranella sp.]|uniref:peptidoglycan recognition protein family protein n=1 Tax=Reyranella sp. TaxID=1929291 RepID=UPI002731146C|nr:peptidoglycan-binding domain-containing protein [Reyranella sp.]MDP2377800.1 peptidoglycan-binding domain-containing protein [Reyranella sp.]